MAITKDILRRMVRDEEFYFRRFLKIVDKKGDLVPFLLNFPQRLLKQILDEQEESLGFIRAIILKARQEGVSTYIQGKIFHRSALRKFRRSLVVSHDLDSAEHIIGMSRIFYQELPSHIAPYIKRSNRRELLFENPQFSPKSGVGSPGLRSYIHVDTAKDYDAGASRTVRYLHLSEVARWANAKQLLTSLLQTVPREADTIVALESTAQGISGEFPSRYWSAKSGDGDYEAIFLPWFINPEYRVKLKEGEVLELDEDEIKLIKRFQISMEQIKWRRTTLATNFENDLDQFKQEYPADDMEAFIASGTRKFKLDYIQKASENVQDPMYRCNISLGSDDTLTFEPHRKGLFAVWEEPSEEEQYMIAGDVAEGVDNGDFCSVGVFKRSNGEQVAHLRGRIPPEELGELCFGVGRWYNFALMAIESNGPGLVTNIILRNKGYPKLYYSKKKDEKTNERTRKVGYLTTSRTRSLAIGFLAESLRYDEIIIRDKVIISELMTFVVKENGRVEAEEGCYDDTVIMLGIACTLAVEYPPVDFEREREAKSQIIRERRQKMASAASRRTYA